MGFISFCLIFSLGNKTQTNQTIPSFLRDFQRLAYAFWCSIFRQIFSFASYLWREKNGRFSVHSSIDWEKQKRHLRYQVLYKWGNQIGLATEFRSEKIPRNRLGMDSVIPRKKMLIPRAFRDPRKRPFRSSERNRITQKKLVMQNSPKIT